MHDDVIVLEPGDERAQKIARAMASQTAADVLAVLKNGEHTSSEIAEALAIPMTTVKYHLENLMEAGMIDIVRTRWSKKGREVKIYGLRDQLVIVSPKNTDVREILLKYASLFGVFVLATLMMAVAAPLVFPGSQVMTEDGAAFGTASTEPAPAPLLQKNGMRGEDAGPADGLFAVAFFTGGCALLILLILYDVLVWYRKRR
ncbi:MAG: helix-turn-helix transcriptional regulator [Methanomicrobiales archaeon]|nr:helix-turn-helix transcriptional regulator [Methanomicrobiales archaeon]